MLTVHPDVKDLLWISDGPAKNYDHTREINAFNYEGIRMILSGSEGEEPSLISTKLPFAAVDDVPAVERPPYYPVYARLTTEQRGVYWKFLENPYDTSIDIGYVFILYYGLERHLLEGDYEKAFDVILKLRDVHQNRSFQNYSARALILTCLFRQRKDLSAKFFASLDKQYELKFPDNLYLLCKLGLDMPLTRGDMMRMAKTFEFSNTHYIKRYPGIFEGNLLKLLRQRHGADSLVLRKYVTRAEWKKLRTEPEPVFANQSLEGKTIDVPMIAACFRLKKAVYDLLAAAHEATKAELAQMRKTGDIPAEVEQKSEAKLIEQTVFDTETEDRLLAQLKRNDEHAVDKHFSLIALQEFYHKYRKLDPKYLELCIHFCNEDISLLPQVQTQYRKDEEESIRRLSKAYSKKAIAQQIAGIGHFAGSIPAFKRLVILYEKSKDYQTAIAGCDRAIDYYTHYGMGTEANEFESRKEKLMNKLNNSAL